MSWFEKLNERMFKEFLLKQYNDYLIDLHEKMTHRIEKSKFTMEVDWPLHNYLKEITDEIEVVYRRLESTARNEK